MVVDKDVHLVYKEPTERPPCQVACPVGIDISRQLRFIAQGQFAAALAVILERLPFPSVCGRVCTAPCELKCRLSGLGGAVPIRALKRFLTEKAPPVVDQRMVKPTGKRVAIIGSGPAGLTAGYYLAKLGHKVTVFEALHEPGGMMRYGIPDYRLPKDVLAAEVEAIRSAGVEIETNKEVSSIDVLHAQGYDAVLVTVGAHRPVKLGVDGEDSPGVIDGLTLLRDVNQGKKVNLGGRVAVIGGGNAAVDAARVAIRMGANEVTIFYRRSRQEMLASQSEVEEALLEGVRIEFLSAPVKIAEAKGVLKMKCLRMRLGGADASGRRRPKPVPGTEFTVDVDTVITAVGQVPDIPSSLGLALTKKGTIDVSEDTLAANRPGIFAAGDAVTGPASIIEAIAGGRKAAASIDRYLGGGGAIDEVLAVPQDEVAPVKTPAPVGERAPLPSLPLNERLGNFAEVERSFSQQVAVEQATRCLGCDLPIIADVSKCAGCLTCMLRCSFRDDAVFNLAASRIQVRRLVNKPNEFEISFSDECDACGICVKYCPYGALTRQKIRKEM